MRQTLFAALFIGFAAVAAAQTQTPSDVYAFAQSWINATGFVAEARDMFAAPSEGADAAQKLMASMTANRRAALKLQSAAQLLPSPEVFPPESVEREAIEGFNTFIQVLKSEFDKSFALDQRLVTIRTDEDVAKIMADTAELTAQIDDTWKILPQVNLVLSFALVDQERATDGKLQHLRLTRAQRRELTAEIQKQFPAAAKGLVGGQHAVDASMALLLRMLNGEHRSADEK